MASSSGVKPGMKMAANRISVWATAVGKKVIMAITGLALCLYLVAHLFGNTLLLWPDTSNQYKWFNGYANFLTSLPILLVVELGLAAIFLIHIIDGFKIWSENKAARGSQEYHYKTWARTKSDKSRKTVSSTTMMVTGIIMLLFVVLHVWHMKFYNSIGPANPVVAAKQSDGKLNIAETGVGELPTGQQSSEGGKTPGQVGKEHGQLAEHLIFEFKKPYVTLLYLFCVFVVGMHLYHAVSSAFQSLGLDNGRMTWGLLWFGRIFTIVIAGGFFLIPLWAWLIARTPVVGHAEAEPAPIALNASAIR
jgi:succinate dehydrogenase / fumarate reductase cytochrome b subunit